MSARVLVVDDVAANVRLLRAKLDSEYYDVLTAENGLVALKVIREQLPDIILLDVMMPGMDGFAVCREIKADPATAHIPVVMVTALHEISDRVEGLEAGADDFLTKPPNDMILLARIRSLVRMKRAGDEWRAREATLMSFGASPAGGIGAEMNFPGDILLCVDDTQVSTMTESTLSGQGHRLTVVRDCAEAFQSAEEKDFDLVLTDDVVMAQDALRFCSQLRSQPRTRHWPILLMVNESDSARIAKALELGVSDYLTRPIVRDELIARARGQVRRKWYEDGLRASFERGLAAAVTDSLTGLNNRRYLEAHYEAIAAGLVEGAKPISLMILDLDRFKKVNDTYGHAVGDALLKGVALRIQSGVRGVDTAVRLGGEEFVVLMPNTPETAAVSAAQRLCSALGGAPYPVSGEVGALDCTVSTGVASALAGTGDLDDMLRLADEALYEAKRSGRNRVVAASSLLEPAPPPRQEAAG